jgi:cyclopropane fatty-acyl-phospholipid synthase-like methyltransferase
MKPETPDESNGWNTVATEFMARRDRSVIGVATVRKWTTALRAGASILDLGCGHGVPISAALIDDGFVVYGVDASPTLVAEFRRRFSNANVACEAAEKSNFFGRKFDAAIAIGLMFLLSSEAQRSLVHRVAGALNRGGRFLFTAPAQRAMWHDILTGRQSHSLGRHAYKSMLLEAGMKLVDEYVDEGENHYYESVKPE